MEIRTATMADLPRVAAVEAACFPAAEAATEADFAARLAVYPNHFWLLEQDGELISFINGMVSDEPDLRMRCMLMPLCMMSRGLADDFRREYHAAVPAAGMAARVMERVIADAKAQGRNGLCAHLQGPAGPLL